MPHECVFLSFSPQLFLRGMQHLNVLHKAGGLASLAGINSMMNIGMNGVDNALSSNLLQQHPQQNQNGGSNKFARLSQGLQNVAAGGNNFSGLSTGNSEKYQFEALRRRGEERLLQLQRMAGNNHNSNNINTCNQGMNSNQNTSSLLYNNSGSNNSVLTDGFGNMGPMGSLFNQIFGSNPTNQFQLQQMMGLGGINGINGGVHKSAPHPKLIARDTALALSPSRPSDHSGNHKQKSRNTSASTSTSNNSNNNSNSKNTPPNLDREQKKSSSNDDRYIPKVRSQLQRLRNLIHGDSQFNFEYIEEDLRKYGYNANATGDMLINGTLSRADRETNTSHLCSNTNEKSNCATIESRFAALANDSSTRSNTGHGSKPTRTSIHSTDKRTQGAATVTPVKNRKVESDDSDDDSTVITRWRTRKPQREQDKSNCTSKVTLDTTSGPARTKENTSFEEAIGDPESLSMDVLPPMSQLSTEYRRTRKPQREQDVFSCEGKEILDTLCDPARNERVSFEEAIDDVESLSMNALPPMSQLPTEYKQKRNKEQNRKQWACRQQWNVLKAARSSKFANA